MFLRTGRMWTSLPEAAGGCCANDRPARTAQHARLTAGVDQFGIGTFQLLAVFGVHGFGAAARGFKRYAVTLTELGEKSVGSGKKIRYGAFRFWNFIHHLTGIRRD